MNIQIINYYYLVFMAPWRIVTGSGLADWIFWRIIQSTRIYKQYSAVAGLHNLQFTATHALGFSIFTSRILVTELKQSHCD
jgi:hypothetical protein